MFCPRPQRESEYSKQRNALRLSGGVRQMTITPTRRLTVLPPGSRVPDFGPISGQRNALKEPFRTETEAEKAEVDRILGQHYKDMGFTRRDE